MKKILIADDETLLRQGIKVLLQKHGYQVSEAATGDELYEQYVNNNPDLILTDIRMPGTDGSEIIWDIRRTNNEIPIVAMTNHEEKYLVDMLIDGVDSYLWKSKENIDSLIDIIDSLAEDKEVDTRAYVVKSLRAASKNDLTTREKQVMNLVKSGYSSTEIAKKLYISPFTVENHRKNILNKTGCRNTIEMINKMSESYA